MEEFKSSSMQRPEINNYLYGVGLTWNTSIAARATVSSQWFSSGDGELELVLFVCLNINCRSTHEIRNDHCSRF